MTYESNNYELNRLTRRMADDHYVTGIFLSAEA